jgi:hypothetical protein
MTTITYHQGRIDVQCIADATKPVARATNKYMADYLRKKLLGKSAGPTQERLVRDMSDDELVLAYASYQEQKHAKVTITR